MLDRTKLHAICQEIYRRFPDLEGKRPKVQAQRGPQGAHPSSSGNYVLTFQGQGQASNQQIIPRLVRVVVNPEGKIIKVSTSH